MSNRSEVVTTAEGRMYHLGIAPQEVASCVFLVGDPDRAYRVARRFESIDHEARNREYVTLTGGYRGIEMSVVGTGIGTDNVEIALIELDATTRIEAASGHRRPDTWPLDIIRIGTSGGVQPDVPAGTLCNAEYALGLDSTGMYYETPMPDSVVAEIEMEAARLLGVATDGAARFGGNLPVYASKAHTEVSAALTRGGWQERCHSNPASLCHRQGSTAPQAATSMGWSTRCPTSKTLLRSWLCRVAGY